MFDGSCNLFEDLSPILGSPIFVIKYSDVSSYILVFGVSSYVLVFDVPSQFRQPQTCFKANPLRTDEDVMQIKADHSQPSLCSRVICRSARFLGY